MSGERKRKVYSIRFPQSLHDPIEELSKELDIPKSEIIRNALKTYVILKMAEKEGKRVILQDMKTGEMEWLILT